MTTQNADNVLDTYIDELKSGERTLEASLWSLGRHESRLASALKTAMRINNVCKTIVLDPARQQVTREHIMAVAEQRCWESGVERSATHKLPREKKQLFNMGRLATQFGAVALALTVASGASVAMAAESIPGSPLYPVKRAAESVRLALTFDDGARGKLLLKNAQERTEEFNRLGAKSPYRNGLISEIKQNINTANHLANDVGAVGITPALNEFIKENADVINGTKESLGAPSVGKSGKGGEQPNKFTNGAVATPSSIVPSNVQTKPTPGDPSTKNEANISNGAASTSKNKQDASKPTKSVTTPASSATSLTVKPKKDSNPSETVTSKSSNSKALAPSKNSGDVNSGNAPAGSSAPSNKDTGNSNSSSSSNNSNSSSNSSNNTVDKSNNSSNSSSDNSIKSDKDKVNK